MSPWKAALSPLPGGIMWNPPGANFGVAHFLLAAGWGSWEGCGFEVDPPKVGFYPQSVVNPHLGPTVFAKSISQGPAWDGPNLQQLKSQSFRRLEWYSLSLPGCWRVSGIQYLLILLFDLHLEREGPSGRSCVRSQCWLGRCLQIPLQGCSEHSPGLRRDPFPTESSTIQRFCHSGEGSNPVMEVFVCLLKWSWGNTFMRAYAHARDVCSDSLSSPTAQSLEQDGIRASFLSLETQNNRATQIMVSKKKTLTVGRTCVWIPSWLSPLAATQLHKEFGMDSCVKPSKKLRKETINLLFVVPVRIN